MPFSFRREVCVGGTVMPEEAVVVGLTSVEPGAVGATTTGDSSSESDSSPQRVLEGTGAMLFVWCCWFNSNRMDRCSVSIIYDEYLLSLNSNFPTDQNGGKHLARNSFPPPSPLI